LEDEFRFVACPNEVVFNTESKACQQISQADGTSDSVGRAGDLLLPAAAPKAGNKNAAAGRAAFSGEFAGLTKFRRQASTSFRRQSKNVNAGRASKNLCERRR
jgi:hypothetical protein